MGYLLLSGECLQWKLGIHPPQDTSFYILLRHYYPPNTILQNLCNPWYHSSYTDKPYLWLEYDFLKKFVCFTVKTHKKQKSARTLALPYNVKKIQKCMPIKNQ